MRAICTLLAIMICGLPATAQEATFSTRQLTPETAIARLSASACRTSQHSPVTSLSLQNIRINLQSLKLIDFHLFLWSLQQYVLTALTMVGSVFKTSAQLRLENLALRQQLAVLRRSAPKRPKLTSADSPLLGMAATCLG